MFDPDCINNPEKVTTEQQARELAIEWQHWASEQSMSWLEASNWECFFAGLVERFHGLAEEFKENAIC